MMSAINKAIQMKSIFKLEHRVRQINDSIGWTLSRAVPILNANGEIVEFFGAASDIIERKQMEMKIRESEERHALLSKLRDSEYTTLTL